MQLGYQAHSVGCNDVGGNQAKLVIHAKHSYIIALSLVTAIAAFTLCGRQDVYAIQTSVVLRSSVSQPVKFICDSRDDNHLLCRCLEEQLRVFLVSHIDVAN